MNYLPGAIGHYSRPMKIEKNVLLITAVAALVAGGVYLSLVFLDNARLLAAANANKSGNLFNDPMHNIFLVSGLALAGGLLLGLGIGLPVQTRGAVRRDALDEVNAQRRSAIAKGAAQHASLPEQGAPELPAASSPAAPQEEA